LLYAEFKVIETLLKGLEVHLPEDYTFKDKEVIGEKVSA
jgi:hypothetical protein